MLKPAESKVMMSLMYVYRQATEWVASELQQVPVVADTAPQPASQQLESQTGLLTFLVANS